MSDSFDRAPGAGRGRSRGLFLGRGGGGPEGGGFPNGAGPAERSQHQSPPPPQPKAPGFLQPPPLRQPRTAPPPGAQSEAPAGSARPPRPGALPGTEQLEGPRGSWASFSPRAFAHAEPRRAESAPCFSESIPRGARSAREQTKPQRAPPSSQDKIPQQNSESAMAKPQVVVAPVLMSKLSANAPEFYPSGYSSNYTDLKTSRGLFEEMKKTANNNVVQVIEWVVEKMSKK